MFLIIHTPRNSLKALNEGRRLGYPARSKKENSRDFTKPPVLQPAYMQNGEHNVKKAIEYLRAAIRGFWVEMPLEWGSGQGTSPEAPVKLPEMIATNQDDNLEVV